MIKFSSRHRNISPIILPGTRVNIKNGFNIFFALFFIVGQGTDLHIIALGNYFCHFGNAFRDGMIFTDEGIEIHCFEKTVVFVKLLVIGKVVRHHNHWRCIKTLNKQTAFIIHAEVHRTPHSSKIAIAIPLQSCIKKSISNFLLFNTLKETEETDIFVMFFIMLSIGMGRNSANRFSIFLSKKQFNLRMIIVGILLRVKKLFLVTN